MAVKKSNSEPTLGYVPDDSAKHLFHIEVNTRIHDDIDGEYSNNWNKHKFSEADFIDFARNGSNLKIFKPIITKVKDANGNNVVTQIVPKTAKEALKIFDVEGNDRYIKLLWNPAEK